MLDLVNKGETYAAVEKAFDLQRCAHKIDLENVSHEIGHTGVKKVRIAEFQSLMHTHRHCHLTTAT